METDDCPTMGIFVCEAEPRPFSLGTRTSISIGREIGCDLVLKDHRVSRQHAVVELVQDQHLLRDLGSANGTFLNGLRIEAARAFTLRAGDVIEIGNERLLYGPVAELEELKKIFNGAGTAEGESHALENLVRDGYWRLGADERTEVQVEVQRAFDGVPRVLGLEQALGVVKRRLDVDAAVLFHADAQGRLTMTAARPPLPPGETIRSVAQKAWRTGEGALVVTGPNVDAGIAGETSALGVRSVAAVPIVPPGENVALAVERSEGKRLHRADLAVLAVLGQRIALTLQLLGAAAADTKA